MCNFKLLCCAAYILNLTLSIGLSCWPSLWCSGVFSAEFRSFRKNSANPDISRKYGSASQIFLKNPAEGSNCSGLSNSIAVSPTLLSASTGCVFSSVSSSIKLAVLIYKFLFSQAPRYLGPLVRVAYVPGRRTLRSANTDRLLVPSVRLASIGGRAFPVAALRT